MECLGSVVVSVAVDVASAKPSSTQPANTNFRCQSYFDASTIWVPTLSGCQHYLGTNTIGVPAPSGCQHYLGSPHVGVAGDATSRPAADRAAQPAAAAREIQTERPGHPDLVTPPGPPALVTRQAMCTRDPPGHVPLVTRQAARARDPPGHVPLVTRQAICTAARNIQTEQAGLDGGNIPPRRNLR